MKKSSIELEENNITITYTFNGEKHEVKTANVLEALRFLEIEPMKIKTVVMFEITYQNKTFHKRLNIPQMRMILANDMRRQLFAKLANSSLGISIKNYE